jgi:tryptophanyl-tRNA synthetase
MENLNEIPQENKDLVMKFGALLISKLTNLPDFYTFKKGLLYTHRDFDKFLSRLKKGEKSAIVSGLNASGTLHIGHKIVFDTNLYFQKKYNLPVFIPISDDESYLTGKIKTQEEALGYSIKLARELIAYGFNPKKTYFIIDQVYTPIYNLAIKLSKKITVSEIKSSYGYKNEDNPGMYFYPSVQAAHILFPEEKFKIKNILVPIGPDEDSHIRIGRDIASRAGYNKPAILHARFLPGLDGRKMSKSKNNAIFLEDKEDSIRKKVNKAFSGGQDTLEEHRKHGGNPDLDVSFFYLKNFFLSDKEANKIEKDYKSGKLLSGKMKEMLSSKIIKLTKDFQRKIKKVNQKDLDKSILK